MSKVVSLADYKKNSESIFIKESYQRYVDSMGIEDLLEEMVKFQDTTKSKSFYSLDLVDHGLILFKAIHKKADTSELKRFSLSYTKHLEFEKLRLKATKL